MHDCPRKDHRAAKDPPVRSIERRWLTSCPCTIKSRRIELPAYRMRFESEGRRTEVEDPLPLLIGDFVARARAGAVTEPDGLVRGMRGLARLMRAAERASVADSAD